MHMQPLNDYLLLFATGLFPWHTRHQPIYFETRMKSKVGRHKNEFKYMRRFPGSSGSPLSPSPQCERNRKRRKHSPLTPSQPWMAAQELPIATAAFIFTQHRLAGPTWVWAACQSGQQCKASETGRAGLCPELPLSYLPSGCETRSLLSG